MNSPAPVTPPPPSKFLAAAIWALVLSPLVGFLVLAVLHPVGDPQTADNGLVRCLDFLGTYGVRTGAFWPPPLTVVGTFVAFAIRKKTPAARGAAWVGAGLLALWGFVMLVPYLIHVN